MAILKLCSVPIKLVNVNRKTSDVEVPTIVELLQRESCKPVLSSLLKIKLPSCLMTMFKVLNTYKDLEARHEFRSQLADMISMEKHNQVLAVLSQ